MENSFLEQNFAYVFILLAISCVGQAANQGGTSTEFIKSSCTATTYPKLCFTSLSIHANSIQTNPQLLASTALGVSLSSAKSTSLIITKLSKTSGMTSKEVAAMSDCIEELSDAVEQINQSIGKMNNLKNPDFQLIMSDVQTWVSAALTDEMTCTDGFGGVNMNGNMKTTVRSQIVNVAQLTSNALALINRYAILHG